MPPTIPPDEDLARQGARAMNEAAAENGPAPAPSIGSVAFGPGGGPVGQWSWMSPGAPLELRQALPPCKPPWLHATDELAAELLVDGCYYLVDRPHTTADSEAWSHPQVLRLRAGGPTTPYFYDHALGVWTAITSPGLFFMPLPERKA